MPSTLKTTRFNPAQTSRKLAAFTAFGTVAAAALAVPSANAAQATHSTTTTSGNFSAATFTNGTPNSTTTGDVAQYNGTAASSLALDTNVTIGQLLTANTGAFALTAVTGSSLTLDNTGGNANIFGLNNSAIGTSSSGTLTVAPAISIANTDLDVGGIAAGAVTINGAITATSTRNLTFRANGTGTITDMGTIGATGSATNVVNASSGTGNKTVLLSGAIGGASGTGAPITISNTATNSGAFNISGVLGASVSSITQNSAGSVMTISGTNNAAGGFAAAGSSGTVTVTAGTLKVGSVNAFGAANALTINGGTFDLGGVSGNIIVGSLTDGGVMTGTLTDSGTSRQLVVNGSTTSTFGGLINAAAGIQTLGTTNLTLTNTNTFTGGTTVGSGTTIKGTNTQAFGSSTAANAITVAAGTLVLANDGTGSNQTIVYGGTANPNGYNVTASTGTIAVQNNGGASTGNTIQLGQLTFGSTGQLNFTSANNYGVYFANGLTEGAGTGTLTVNTNTTPVTVNGIALTAGKSLTVFGTGALTSTGPLTISSGTGTAASFNVGTTTSGGITGNAVLKGTGSTITGGATVSGGSLTLFNSDSLGSANAITLQQASNTLTTSTLNLRSDTDTVYGNNITAISGTPVFNVDQATAENTGHTLTLGTLNTGLSSTPNQAVTFTNGDGYNLDFGAASSIGTATFNNNMTNGTLTLASFTDSATSAQTVTFGGTSATAATTVTGAIAQNGTNALAVRQNGAGLLTLTGTNTYTGTTTITGGTLAVNGSTAAGSAVTVASGATLSGTGTVGGAVSNSGTINTGGVGTVGTLTTGADTFNSGSQFVLDFGNNTVDELISTGLVTGLSNATFMFTQLPSSTGLTNPSYTLVSAGSFSNTNLPTTVNGTPSGYQLQFSGNNLNLVQVAAAPEPSQYAAFAVGLLGLGALIVRARRRQAVAQATS